MGTASHEALRASSAAVTPTGADRRHPGGPSPSPPASGVGDPRPRDGESERRESYRLLSVREAATALGFSLDKTRHLVRRGHIPSARVGRRLYVPERALAILTQPTLVSMPEGIGRSEAPKRLVFTPRRRRS